MKLKVTSFAILVCTLLVFSACKEVSVIKNNGPAPIAVGSSSPYKDVSTYLSNITSSDGVTAPVFNKTTFVYNIALSYTVASVKVTPTAENTTAVIKVNGVKVNSGEASSSITTDTGLTDVVVTVEKPDGTEQKTYNIFYSKASSDAYLSSLNITPNLVSFTFDKTILGLYSARVSNSTNSISLAATAEHSNATLMVNGIQYGNSTTVTLPLNIGDNNITVVVQPQDNTAPTNTYVINARRLSNNSALTLITNTTYSMQINPPVPEAVIYSWPINFDVSLATLIMTLSDPVNATMTLNGYPVMSGAIYGVPLDKYYPLTADAVIVVTAEDGVTTSTYYIQVVRESVVYLFSGGMTNGNFGGTAGADAKCVQAKALTSIPDAVCSHIHAMVSTATRSISNMPSAVNMPTNRKLIDADVNYVIADNFNTLFTGPLTTSMSTTLMVPFGSFLWTGSLNTGDAYTPMNCNNFSINNSSTYSLSVSADTTGSLLFQVGGYYAHMCSTNNNYLLCSCW